MELGAGFPQRAIGSDSGALRDYVQGVEQLGYAHIRAADHVLGADASQYELEGPYTHHAIFREPFVMFGYAAAVTSRIKLITSVLILSQRQTALVAKQAAELDLLSGGRFELGIGSGWNEVEYEALGVDFATRGSRIEEQIGVLRRLWEEPLVTFEGEHHAIRDAGINPLPNRRIPIWMGGYARVMMERTGRLGDGWLVPPRFHSPEGFLPRRDRVLAAAEQAGRDPAEIGFNLSVSTKGKDLDEQLRRAELWRGIGATRFTVSTNTSGLASVGEHLEALRAFIEAYPG
ncbi:MAG: LLM class F420-dependent oxidoreductase [Chloroflexi bacterium]|nr:LLM class F420-dependent oxidoreductase [Chloroflexota bacterium]